LKIKQQNKLVIFFSVFLLLPLTIHAHVYPVSFIAFRDTVYLQDKDLTETLRLYTATKQDMQNSLSGVDMYLAFSRCEYLMGISFKAAGRDSEAAVYFEQGIEWAEQSLAICPTSEGYLLLGTNISFLCEVRRSYGLRNFGRIEENAERALELDPNNLMAKHLIASKYIVAPWPFATVRKGAAILEEIIRQDYQSLDNEDLFALYLLLEAACLKQKKNQEAQMWRERAAAIYPGNNFICLLMQVR
jgi:tetratricopeptide (TPR) repeat protein